MTTYKKILKKDRVRFETTLKEYFEKHHGIKFEQCSAGSWRPEKGNDTIETIYGPLRLAHFDGQGSVYTLCSAFVDFNRAQYPMQLGINPKWNHHYGSETEASEAARLIIFAINRITEPEAVKQALKAEIDTLEERISDCHAALKELGE